MKKLTDGKWMEHRLVQWAEIRKYAAYIWYPVCSLYIHCMFSLFSTRDKQNWDKSKPQ